jgi:hypothetical protein
MFENTRNVLKLIYKIGMIVLTLMLAGVTILAFTNATTGNGLALWGGILAVFTLIAGLSISKLDWQDERAESYRQLGHEIRHGINLSTSYTFADPEVHHVDATTLDTAKRMASEGAPIDDICRTIDPEHDGHLPVHQEAFRRVVQAMIAS